MELKIQISLILLIIMILDHTDAFSRQKDQNLIETTCKHTPNYQLCTTTLRANRRSFGADVAELGLIMVAAVKAKTKEALSAIHKLRSHQPNLSPALQRCDELYKAVLEGDVPVAEQVIRGNPKFAETAMADAAVEADICEGAFEGMVAKSPLSGVNYAVRDLAVVARAIIRNLL